MPVRLPRECFAAPGTFRFKVGEGGKVDTLVSTVRRRILETEGRWVYPPGNTGKANPSRWFVLPIFIEM